MEHIRCSIVVFEEDIFCEFRVKLGGDVVMSNYWRLKSILSHSMNETESYAKLIHITMGNFKDEAEINLGHMHNLLCLLAPPFQCIPWEEDVRIEESSHAEANQGTRQGNNNAEDEAKSSRRC